MSEDPSTKQIDMAKLDIAREQLALSKHRLELTAKLMTLVIVAAAVCVLAWVGIIDGDLLKVLLSVAGMQGAGTVLKGGVTSMASKVMKPEGGQ